ncbi:MAG TPA: AarF/UbiB family protein [Gaiellaceae bacterium]|nr:AarF/UbiB family protein [Gaiellaceae bacterium]
MGVGRRRLRRVLELTQAARRGHVVRVLREIGGAASREPTPERAREFRQALEELGTTFVKLGQILSSRPDLLPDAYIEELGRLVDDVEPVPFAVLRPIIDGDLGPGVFAEIGEEPLAAASIAQIHPALLANGREVAVKVRRPGVLEQVELDLGLLRSAARLAERGSDRARLLQLDALVDELAAHLRAELDLLEEASNTELIGRIVADEPDLTVPEVMRPWVSERVLVLERIHGEKVREGHGLERDRAGVLARSLFRAYVRQVTVWGVYHADPHRGNVLITDDGRLALLDFGLVGRLADDVRRRLGLLLLALAQNRADDVAGLIVALSLVTGDSDQPGFVHEVRRKLPRYHWRPLAGIETGAALADLQRVALRYRIRLPTSFALVGKTLAQADSIARTLDPDLDPVELVEGDTINVIVGDIGRSLQGNRVAATVFTQVEALARLPRQIGEIGTKLESGTLKVGISPTDLGDLDRVLRSTANRVGVSLIVVGLLVASALMARVNDAVALAGFALSAAIALYLIWKILRTPGEI